MAKKIKSTVQQPEEKAKVNIFKISIPGNPLGLRFPHRLARKKPVLRITINNSRIIGVKTIVRNREESGIISSGEGVGTPFFERGEKIFRVHVDSSDAADIVRLFNALEKNFGKLREAGFTGFYGFSPNHSILNYFKKRFRTQSLADIEVPEKERVWERMNYARGVRDKGFKPDYAEQEVKGFAIRF